MLRQLWTIRRNWKRKTVPAFVASAREHVATWGERFSSQGMAGTEIASWVEQIAQGLAFAHEAGVT